MSIKSKTYCWWHVHEHFKKLSKKRKEFIKQTKGKINPFYFRHERKQVRTELHRSNRHDNRIRLKKGWDILKEFPTNGWHTH